MSRKVALAQADRDLNVDRAAAQKVRRIAYAVAERNYQIALAEAESIDGSDNSVAVTLAATNKLIAKADADLEYKINLASAEAGHVNDLSAANTTLYAAQTTAAANYISADFSGRVLALDNLHTAAQLPYTEFAADADLLHDASSAGETYLSGSQTNANTYINGEAGLATNYDISTTDAWQAWDIALAQADRELNVDRAEAQKVRRMSPGTSKPTRGGHFKTDRGVND